MIYGRAGIRRSMSYSCLVEGLGEGSALAPRLCDSIGEKFLRRDCFPRRNGAFTRQVVPVGKFCFRSRGSSRGFRCGRRCFSEALSDEAREDDDG